jgi:hydroxymethylglutaryl-CoA lyase
MAAPPSLTRVIEAVRVAAPNVPLVLHLHDTRGLGLVNIAAALDAGVRRFDTSLGGLGGCPFIPGATGNVATEDVAYLAQRLGYETGVDLTRVAVASRVVSDHLCRPLSGRMYGLVRPDPEF